MKFNFQRPDGSSVRVEAPSRDAALKYWKAQAKPPTPANASGTPDDRGMVANGPIPLTNPMADPNIEFGNTPGGPDERVPIVAPETANASLNAPTKAEVDAGKNMTGDGLVGASVKAAMNAPGQVLTGVMGLDRSSRDTFTAALDQMAANADELATNPGTQQVFENMARELPSAATGGDPKAFAATMWQRFQDPTQRQAVIKELGMANAKANAGTQLKIAEINKGQQKIDVPEGSLEYYVSSIIGSTAQMSPGLIASVVTKSPLPAMAIIAAQTGGDAYTKASNAGLKPEDAKKYAALYALAETVPEALPLSLILKEGGKALPRMLKGALGEGATEMLTQGIEELIDKGYISPDMTWGEMWPRIRDAGIIGMGAGAGMGALAAGTESAVNTAGAASGEVIGKLQAGLDKVVRQSAMAADMAKMLAGKPLEERIKIYADAKRQQMETPTAAEPTTAEKGGFDPATVIKGFEGFSTTPYWDVNANRAGFGSDTITEADGTVRKVQPGDKVTREDAERDLARRLDTEFIPSIMKEVGVQAWGALDARTQAALASVTYNYGNLPNKVAAAVRTGDTAAIADAVEALGTDNNGVNANRRAEEAAIIRGEEYTPREPVEVKRAKLSTDPATYKGQRTAAVMIGDEVFTGERHAVAVQKAIEQFGAESAQIKAFEANPEAAIGQLAGKAGETLAGTPYPAGFEVTGMSADGGAEITSVIAKAAKAAPVAQEPPPVAQKPPVEAITPAGKASGDTSSKAIFWVDNADVAKGYRGRDLLKRGEIKEAYLSLKNPRIVDFSNRSDVFDTQLTKGIIVDSALADGHDGVIFTNIIDNKDTRDGTRSTVYAVFDPAQVIDAAAVRAEAVSDPVASAAPSKAKASAAIGKPAQSEVDAFSDALAEELGLRSLSMFVTKSGDLKLNMLAVPKDKLGNGIGSTAMQRIVDFADSYGLRTTLTTGQKDPGFGTTSATRLKSFYKRFGFVENSGRAKDFSTSDNMLRAPKTPAEPKTRTDLDSATYDLKFNPGAGYQPMLQAAAMPARQTSVQVSTGTLAIPDKVTIRDEPRKKLLDLIGERLYQGKVKGKTRLGFYRRNNSEVRIKHFDDIEVMAHEAAHFLDFHHEFRSRFTALRQRFAAEINPLSYTQEPQLINLEGFAEYVRLWSTQYAKAKQVAPNFTAAFEAELKKARLWRKMTAFQESAHRWYYQGDLARFRGKSGESENVVDQFKAFMRSRFAARFLQGIYDPEYGALVMERETTGGVASAERSPYKLRRMTRAAESMTEAAVLDGALVLKPDGSYTTTGPSLMQIFWPAVKKGWAHFDKLMEYFKARRAQELMGQGRENLFSKDEIKAGLEYGKQFPEFEKIFDQWLGFNDAMLDFYVDMNRITPETAAAIRANNTAYVPFFRVINRIDPAFNKMGKGGRVDTRLVGGERNTNEILSNILDGLHANIQSALYSRANSALFKLLGQSQDGSEFAVRISPDSKKFTAAQDQQVKHIADALVQLGFEVVMPSGMVRGNNTTGAAPIDMSDIEDVIAQFPELADFWQHNQEPSTIETMVEPVIIDGKQEYFEVNSPLLAELLTVPRGAPALVRALGAPKRFVTKAITSTIQFMAPNITRDTTSAATQSQSGFTPYIESLRGLKSYLSNDARFKEFRVNGGLFSGRVTSLQEENLNRSMLNFPSRNGFDTVGKALAGYGRVSASFEQGTRIGEFARATEAGANPLEAAYRGRMISGDFAQKGRNELWGWLLETISFANAGMRGTETLLTNMFAVDGKARFNAKSAGKLARMAVTRFGIAMVASTMLLWLLNNDDERYKALTTDEKSRFWHVWLPSGEHIQIPKPYGVGFIFADLPEIAMDFAKARLEGAAHNDAEGKRAINDAMSQLAFSVMQHFWFMDNPAIIAPTIEAMQNRKFTGAPIVPANLSDLRGDDLQYQRTDRTPEVYRRFSETLAKAGINISPLIAEHYMKGFTGYLEAYMVDATESLFWDKEKWGDRPFARGVLDYFTHQFNGSEAPFRTKWTEGYYDLAERAKSKAQAYSTLFKETPRDIRSLTDFTEKDVNLALRSINKITTKINATLAKTAGQLISVKYDPKLTREQKEKQINDYYLARNAELRTAYEQMDGLVTQLEEGKKAKP
jgi:GH24 family phage-related lysozyme (muramidase)/GNAT superfamily N-acetyltransferase